MGENELLEKTIPELFILLRNRDILCSDLVRAVYQNIKLKEEKIGVYLTLRINEALEEAKKIDKEKIKIHSYLFGIPISIKDTFTTEGIKTTAGSKILTDFIPPYNATVVRRLKENKAIIVGKTNMDEFAHGFTTEYSAFKITHNPWDTTKVPGGSSGGSAASVACREAFLSLASENYGSIIQPSSLCGVVGMKPTYGRASRYGIIAMASSLECPGIIGRCVEDVAIGIGVIAGWDPKDATTVDYPLENYFKNLGKSVDGKKIAIIKPIIDQIDPQIATMLEKSLHVFKSLGVKIKYIDWYDLDLDAKIYDVLYRAEVASNLARYDGIRYGYRNLVRHNSLDDYYLSARDKFGKHVKRQIITDTITLTKRENDVYRMALKLRRKNRNFIDSLFKIFDAIITPATTFIDLKIGKVEDKKWREQNRKYGRINAAMMCPTVLYGYLAISFPIGISDSKMPVGTNLFSFRFGEQTLLNLAYAFQEESGFKCLRPKI